MSRLVAGVSRADYDSRREVQLALERCLHMTGEIACRLTEKTRRANPEIEWAEIIGLRNLLARDYGAIVQGRLHEIATDVMPGLADKLEKILPPLPLDEE